MPLKKIQYKNIEMNYIYNDKYKIKIFLPLDYYIVYDIIGSYFGLREDLDDDIIEGIKCKNIFIHNINPKIINIDKVSSIDDIMNIFSSSFIITIYLDKNQNVKDIAYDYLISDNEYRRIYLSEYLNLIKEKLEDSCL